MAAPPVLSRRANLLCLVALVVGAILRFWAIGKDIPYSVAIDEPAIVQRAYDMVRTGSLNPNGFFDYGTLSMYIQVVVVIARFLSGAMGGMWSTFNQTTLADYYLWGREVTAMIGVATIAIVYRIGARWGERTAVIAAVFMAVQPWHTLSSHFILTDVPLTFLVAATMLASLRASEARMLVWLAVSAAFAGLAAAAKYNGALALLMPVTMAVLWSGRRGWAVLVVFAASGAAFLIAAPYTVLDLPGFLNAFGRLMGHFSQTNPHALSIYLKHIRLSLGIGGRERYNAGHTLSAGPVLAALSGWLLLWAAGLGLLLALWRAIGRPALAPMVGFLIFSVFYFRLLSSQSGQIFARYLMPVVPLLALGLALSASAASDAAARRFRSNRARATVSAAVLALVVLPGLYQSLTWDRDWAKVSAASLAHDWMLTHVRPSERMVVENFVLRPETPRFTVEYIDSLINKSIDQYRDEGVVYLIATSLEYDRYMDPKNRPAEYAAYQTLFRTLEEVARFDAGPNNSPGSSFRVLKIPR